MKTYGAIKIMDVSAFVAPKHEGSPEAFVEEILGTQLPTTTRDWAKITRSIKYESFINLSVSSPSLQGSIRFDSLATTEGVYDIRILSENLVERGSISSVKHIPESDAAQHPFTGLQSFPIRFFVKTFANDRQGTQRVWLIGISCFQTINPDDPSAPKATDL